MVARCSQGGGEAEENPEEETRTAAPSPGVRAGAGRLGITLSLIESCNNYGISSQLLSWWLRNSSPDVGFNSLAIRCIDFF